MKISTDGDREMTGLVFGVPTPCRAVTLTDFISVWRGAHHADIRLQSAYCKLANEDLHRHLTALVSSLWRQQDLIAELWLKATTLSGTRWELLRKASTWILMDLVAVKAQVEQNQLAKAFSPTWKNYMKVRAEFSALVPLPFKSR